MKLYEWFKLVMWTENNQIETYPHIMISDELVEIDIKTDTYTLMNSTELTDYKPIDEIMKAMFESV